MVLPNTLTVKLIHAPALNLATKLAVSNDSAQGWDLAPEVISCVRLTLAVLHPIKADHVVASIGIDSFYETQC